MATASEGTLINFCDENENGPVRDLNGPVIDPPRNDPIQPTVMTKQRNLIQAEYDSGVEDDNQHGKKTLSPDTPSSGPRSPPVQEVQEQEEPKPIEPQVQSTIIQEQVHQEETTRNEETARQEQKVRQEEKIRQEQKARQEEKARREEKIPQPDKVHEDKKSHQARPKTTVGSSSRTVPIKDAASRPKTSHSRSTTPATKKTIEKERALSPRIPGKKAEVKNVQSKVGSLDYAAHKPGGGNVKIESRKLDFSTAKSKIAANQNLAHVPGGGDKKVLTQKLEWKAQSKIGSLQNATHKPAGGNVKIADVKTDFTKTAKSKIGSLENATHKPKGGAVKIKDEKVDFSKTAKSKIGSLENADHKPGGGDVKITNEKLKFEAAAKIGSIPDTKRTASSDNQE